MIRNVIILGLIAVYVLPSCVVQDGNGGYYIPQPLIPPFPRIQQQQQIQPVYNNYVAPQPQRQQYNRSPQQNCHNRSTTHIVQCGETISSIAYRYRVQPSQITRSYPFNCRQTIYVGDRLTINF